MPILTAENNFRRGLAALVDNNHRDAMVFFSRAIDTERQRGALGPQPRYLSYYGLSLAKSRGSTGEALEACRMAAASDSNNPDLFFNLGRVCLLAGDESGALRAFEQGLRFAPEHVSLLRERSRIERRRAPVLSRLDRSHPLNRWLGRLRARLVRK